MRKLTYAQAINEALSIAMKESDKVITYGLGVPDPKGVFSTTLGLQEKFGPERVFDTPTSENAMTGIGIGAAELPMVSFPQAINLGFKNYFKFSGRTTRA